MTINQAGQFLTMLGAQNLAADQKKGGVRCSCPLAPWLHKQGADRHLSFEIKLEEGKAPYYYCSLCGATGYLPKLLHNLTWLRNSWDKKASGYLSQFELFNIEKAEPKNLGRRIKIADCYAKMKEDRVARVNILVPAEVLEHFPLLTSESDLFAHEEVIRWLTKDKKISLQSIATFQLRLYVSPIGEAGVVFPIIDKNNGNVLDLWVRLSEAKRFWRLELKRFNTPGESKARNLWFGNHIFDPTKGVFLVEDAMDALRLHSIGLHNVLASMGPPSNEQLEGFPAAVVYLAFDADDAGRRHSKKVYQTINAPSVTYLDWSKAGIKDAGGLQNREQFATVFRQGIRFVKTTQDSV